MTVTDHSRNGQPDPLGRYLEAIRAVPESASYAVIVQDDALPCQNFAPAISRLTAAVPERIVCLFVPGALPHRDAVLGASRSLVRLAPFSWTPLVATLWPAVLAREFAAWAEEKRANRGRIGSDDRAAALWLASRREAALATVPSIVDHDDSVPSVYKPGKSQRGLRERRAAVPLGDRDPLSIVWSERD